MIPPRRDREANVGEWWPREKETVNGGVEGWKRLEGRETQRARKVEREESRWKSRGRQFEVEAKLFSGLAGWLAAGKMQLRCLAAGHS